MRLRIELEQAAARPGEPVTGTVVVLEGGRARCVRAWLEFTERVEKMTVVARSEPPSTLAEGDLHADQALRLELPLPADALPPLTNEVGELRWDLVVEVDRPQFPDLTEREPLA
jgi:hypothetical protein